MSSFLGFSVGYATLSNGLKSNAFVYVEVRKFAVCPLLMSSSARRVKMQLFCCTLGICSLSFAAPK